MRDGPEALESTAAANGVEHLTGRARTLVSAQVDAAVAAACLIAARIDPSAPIDVNAKAYSDRLTFMVDEPPRELAARVFARASDATDNDWHDLWAKADALAQVEAALVPSRTAVGA